MSKPKFKINLQVPIFKEGTGNLGEDERNFIDKAVTAFKKQHVVVFLEHVHRAQWNYFMEKTKGIEGEIVVWGPLGDDWIIDDKKHIKVFNVDMHRQVTKLLPKRYQYPFQYKRDIKNIDKDFLMTYGNGGKKYHEQERECMTQTLERLAVLDNSIYSRPYFNQEMQEHIDIDYIFPIRNQNVAYRNIEGSTQHLPAEYLYDQKKVLPVLSEMSKRVHCYAVLDVFPFNNELNGVPSEKFLWPVFLGVPFIYIGSRVQIEVLRSWGFEPNDPYRDNYRETAEQMMWLKSIFRDPELAQQWQDAQGELITKNWEALKNLPNKLIQ